MDEDPDFGSSVSSSTSQASEHAVDMPDETSSEVTIVWKDLSVVRLEPMVTVLNAWHISRTRTHEYLTADHEGQVDTEAKTVVEESWWIR